MTDGEVANAAADAAATTTTAAAAADASQNAAAPAAAGPVDPEKKAKADAKRALKEAKVKKALERKAAEEAAKKAAAAAGGDAAGNSKKAAAKAEKDAARAAEAAELAAFVEQARKTPPGSKKDYSGAMPKTYDPKFVEAAVYAWWESKGFFSPPSAEEVEELKKKKKEEEENGENESETGDDSTDPGTPFTMVIPPPNVTGSLHLGHALMAAIEDAIVRWARMRGRPTLWVPGTDHAGIATQTVVEKTLAREKGLTRHDLGREKFVDEVHAWVDKYGNTICSQLRRVGASPDWKRQAFTMDSNLSAAVQEAFLRLHAEGLIYRDHRLVNWSSRLKTAISDIEVDYIDIPAFHKLKVPGYAQPVEFGVLTSFAYPLVSSSEPGKEVKEGEEMTEIVVATTRPETMMGDSAVAVHPEDPRYKHLIGSHVRHPLDGRLVPIIADAELVDMDFGTGAVKITPAHDPNDFATGKRHGLEFRCVFDDDGNVNAAGGQFAGMPRFEARVKVVEWLKELGLFRGVEGNAMRLGLCSRSGDVVEPMLKPQWWVSCSGMAKDAADAVRNGELKIVPAEASATWYRWLDGIRDWCVSRQLWWGHRIPAFYVVFSDDDEGGDGKGGEGGASSSSSSSSPAPAPAAIGLPGTPTEATDRWVVAPDEAAATLLAQQRYPGRAFTLRQDEDVLDTWFSSGIFPFSVFGWPKPESAAELERFYPTTLLETGHDILFFWVARMVMMGLKLTGKLPFTTIYLHTMVRDAHGRKMSKSLGNVIDPLHVIDGISLADLHATLEGGNLDAKEVAKAKEGQKADFPEGIEECGADALRMALVSYTTQARDINLDIKRVVTYRYWCNKLWNAIRFAMMNLGEGFSPDPGATRRDKRRRRGRSSSESGGSQEQELPLACRWILSRLDAAAAASNAGFEGYDFSAVVNAAYAFWQYELCDVFIELVKPAVAAAAKGKEDGGGGGANAADAEANAEAFRQTLWSCLEAGLRLLHPLMPFVTEELWQRLPKPPVSSSSSNSSSSSSFPSSIMVARYPTAVAGDNGRDPRAEADMGAVLSAVQAVRTLRSSYGLTTRAKPRLHVLPRDAAAARPFGGSGGGAGAGYLAALAPSEGCDVEAPLENSSSLPPAPAGCGVAVVSESLAVAVQLAGVLDPKKELLKLSAKRDDARSRGESLRKKRAAAAYAEKTPADVQASDAEKLSSAEAELRMVEEHIAEMEKLSLSSS